MPAVPVGDSHRALRKNCAKQCHCNKDTTTSFGKAIGLAVLCMIFLLWIVSSLLSTVQQPTVYTSTKHSTGKIITILVTPPEEDKDQHGIKSNQPEEQQQCSLFNIPLSNHGYSRFDRRAAMLQTVSHHYHQHHHHCSHQISNRVKESGGREYLQQCHATTAAIAAATISATIWSRYSSTCEINPSM